MTDELPEEFAPTGPKLSKFPIRPAPPMRPHLFADEARFARRLAILCGSTEFLAWFWLGSGERWALLAFAGLRLLKPLWAKLGTHIPRTAVAWSLLAAPALAWVALLVMAFGYQSTGAFWLGLVALGLPALGDLCATCVADSVTVERRATAYAWLDMGQGLGAPLGYLAPHLIRGEPLPSLIALFGLSFGALLVAAICARELHDRGTPRSSWPLSAYASALRSPIGWKLAAFAFACAALASLTWHTPLWQGVPLISQSTLDALPRWLPIVALIAGMAAAARLERLMPNAITLPRAATGFAAIGLYLSLLPLSMFGMGMMFAALPAAVARGAGEMERPLVSSLAWSALFTGAALVL